MKKILFLLVTFCLIIHCGCQISSNHLADLSTPSTSSTILSTSPKNISELPQNPIPAPYADILNDYSNLVEFRLSPSFEENWNANRYIYVSDTLTRAQFDPGEDHSRQGVPLGAKWSDMLVSMTNGINDPQITSFGYMLEDINRDGFPELFWIREDKTILALFTIQNNSVVLLDAFSPRHSCVISGLWNLYTIDYGGAGYTHYEIRVLDIDGNLTPVIQFGTCGFTDEGNVVYYQTVDQKNIYISESAFNKLLKKYPYIFCEEYLDWQITHLSPVGQGGQGDGLREP